jgi:hypothetical protein
MRFVANLLIFRRSSMVHPLRFPSVTDRITLKQTPMHAAVLMRVLFQHLSDSINNAGPACVCPVASRLLHLV